jgi:hypothetical protein
MSSGYLYNGINITNLVASGGTTVPGYTGFPQSFPPSCTYTGFDRPANFSYSNNGTDVSTTMTAHYFQNSTTNTTQNIPILIPNTSTSFKSISICCAGGGAGGAGGGSNTNVSSGGDGGNGGDGSYAALLDYPLSGYSSINYKIGNFGYGGDGVNGSDVGTGKSGNGGNDTNVYLESPSNSLQLIYCPGGNTGNGGKAAPGSDGSDGNTPDSKVNAPSNFSYIESTDSPAYTPQNFPPQNTSATLSHGNGGGGGNAAAGSGKSNSGSPGNTGFVLFYFSYEA